MTKLGMGNESTERSSVGLRTVTALGRWVASLFRLTMKLSLIIAFVAFGMFIGGFLQFTSKIANAESSADRPASDAIVVLTGGSHRISTALDLLSQQKGRRLLISGVHKKTRAVDIENRNPTHHDLFDCCVDIETEASDTIGNAVEARRWMKKNGYGSLILVTSAYHMPRSLVEFRRQMPEVKLFSHAVPLNAINREGWWKNSDTLRFIVSEYLKYVGAWSRRYFNANTLDAIRARL